MTSRRTALAAKIAVVPVALVASGIIVSTASYSAYTATTSNPNSNWTAGTVKLVDDDANTAMFSAVNLKPGSTGTKCITVTSSGSLASTVKMYTVDAGATKSIDEQINVTVTRGTGGSFGTCSGYVQAAPVYTGTLAGLTSTATDFASGVGAWTTTGAAQSATYQITYTLSADAPNRTQGAYATAGLTWEAQNN